MADRIEKVIGRRFRAAHMSDTKWRKCFEALASSGLRLSRCLVKCVDADRVSILTFPFRWLDETHIEPCGIIEYREIEWCKFPTTYAVEHDSKEYRPPTVVQQDTAGALEALRRTGQFPAELTPEGLVIRGYT